MVEEIFPRRLYEQRKKKKISQKQAAKDLEISQALLSHYENGVRECGLSFVVKAADYYGVSCDYLLGKSNNIINLGVASEFNDIPEDEKMCSDTVVRAALSIGSKINKSEEMVEYMRYIFGMSTYFVLYGAIKKGALPESWACGTSLNPKRIAYLAATIPSTIKDIEPNSNKKLKNVGEIPASVKTIASWANDYLNISIANLL